MAWTLKCPACQAEVQAEDSWVGRTVRCPVCQVAFVAQPDEPTLDEVPPTAVTSRRRVSSSPSARPLAREEKYDDHDEDDSWEDDRSSRRRNQRRRSASSTGNSIATLVLGILSLVLSLASVMTCFSFLLSFALSPIAIYLGMVDLAAIRRGEVSEDAHGAVLAGLVTAWIGLAIALLLALSCGGLFGLTLLHRP